MVDWGKLILTCQQGRGISQMRLLRRFIVYFISLTHQNTFTLPL